MSYEDDSQWPNQDDNWKMNRGHHGRKWNSRTNNRCDYRHPPADGNWNNFNCQFPDDDKTWYIYILTPFFFFFFLFLKISLSLYKKVDTHTYNDS